MNLRLKIMGATLLLLMASSLATIGAMYYLLAHRMENELVKRCESIARHTARSTVDPILTENTLTLQLLVRETMRHEADLRYFFILNREGTVLAHSFQVGFPTELRAANAPAVDGALRVRPLMIQGERIYDVAAAIAGGDLGVVRLGFSAADLQQGLRRFLGVALLLLLGIVIVVAGVAVAIDHRVTAPVSRLIGAVQAIGAGRLDRRVRVEGGDDIGKLAGAFNKMMERVESSHTELVALNRDLEEEIAVRREAEMLVREREEELRIIFESTPVMMALIDRDGSLRRINRTWTSSLADDGAASEELRIGSAIRCVNAAASPGGCGRAPECEECQIRRVVSETLARRISYRQVEATLPVERDDARETARLLVSSTPIAILGEEMALVSVEDITRMKEAETRLQEAYEDLKKLDIIKSSLIRDVTHELKTPVAKFVMQMDMLKKRLASSTPPEIWRGSLEQIEKNLRRQEGVIRNLLSLERLESGTRRYRSEPVRLDRLIEEVIDDYRLLLDSRGITVSADLAPVEIVSDREMLWHVFSNLMSNAVKFSSDGSGGSIRLRTEDAPEGVVVKVKDSGRGFTAEEQERVFDLFYQSSASVEGLGVGLSLSRTIVEGLGGTIQLDSGGYGMGATATVFLPARAPSPAGA